MDPGPDSGPDSDPDPVADPDSFYFINDLQELSFFFKIFSA